MNKIICGFFWILILAPLVGQEGMEVRIEPGKNHEESPKCFTIDIRNVDADELKLASMNYRIFYNSDNLKLIENGVALQLPSQYYSLRIVQDLREVDASGTGPLSFEGNLGFLNYSVIFQDGSNGSIRLEKSDPWLSVTEMCFELLNEVGMQSIVLARNEITARYGKAFVELSAYDKNDQITAAVISSYQDYNLLPLQRSN